jgi:ABC-type nitrate/sulfonate/bicarbonate transport system substrate-binding protein
VLVRLLRVYYRANVWAIEHKQQAAQYLNDEENGLLPLEIDEKLVDKYSHNYGLNDSAVNAFTETYKFLRVSNIIKNDVNLSSLYTTKFDIESRK